MTHSPRLTTLETAEPMQPAGPIADLYLMPAQPLHFRYPVVNKSVDGAGHNMARLPNRPTSDSVRLGGTAEDLAAAQRSSWRAIVEFLDRHLRSAMSK